jgi:hypothetical protein
MGRDVLDAFAAIAAERAARERQKYVDDPRYSRACESCGAQPGSPCLTGSGYITLRHVSRRRASSVGHRGGER